MVIFTAEEKYREAAREVKMRRRVFGARVSEGAMSQYDADRKIAIMDEIATDYAKLAEDERLI
jgi:hypothetical protein